MDTPTSAQGNTVSETAFYPVPTSHILQAERQTVLDCVSQATTPTAVLHETVVDTSVVAPAMGDFSSRGPFPGANGATMKPDVAAPGGCGSVRVAWGGPRWVWELQAFGPVGVKGGAAFSFQLPAVPWRCTSLHQARCAGGLCAGKQVAKYAALRV